VITVAARQAAGIGNPYSFFCFQTKNGLHIRFQSKTAPLPCNLAGCGGSAELAGLPKKA
jgi:hypothetical protein